MQFLFGALRVKSCIYLSLIVPELSQGVEPTAPPDSMQPVPRPRRRSSQREPLSSTQNYQQQQQSQQQRYQQQRQQNVGLEIGSLVQRGIKNK